MLNESMPLASAYAMAAAQNPRAAQGLAALVH